MAAKTQPFSMIGGNKVILKCEIRDSSNVLVDLTGMTASWALATSRQGRVLVEKSTGGAGITIANQIAERGILYVAIDTVDTASLDGIYYHELLVIDAAGAPVTAMTGDVTIQDSLF